MTLLNTFEPFYNQPEPATDTFYWREWQLDITKDRNEIDCRLFSSAKDVEVTATWPVIKMETNRSLLRSWIERTLEENP